MNRISLDALNPDNPCAYLAGIGLLRLVVARQLLASPRLAWIEEPQGERAVIETTTPIDTSELCELLAKVHDESWIPDAGKDIRNLEPEQWSELGGPTWMARPDHINKKGELIATEWRTYAVKERVGWLAAARVSGQSMSDPEKWHEALVGKWARLDKVSPLGLDPNALQEGATQASEPSSVQPMATAGAIWLAVNAFPLFPLLPGMRKPITSGIADNRFCYPTWTEPLPLSVVKVLCRVAWEKASVSQFTPYGISKIWQSELSLTATGRRQLGFARPR